MSGSGGGGSGGRWSEVEEYGIRPILPIPPGAGWRGAAVPLLEEVLWAVEERPEPMLPGNEPSENAGGKWGLRAMVGARLWRVMLCDERNDWLAR